MYDLSGNVYSQNHQPLQGLIQNHNRNQSLKVFTHTGALPPIS